MRTAPFPGVVSRPLPRRASLPWGRPPKPRICGREAPAAGSECFRILARPRLCAGPESAGGTRGGCLRGDDRKMQPPGPPWPQTYQGSLDPWRVGVMAPPRRARRTLCPRGTQTRWSHGRGSRGTSSARQGFGRVVGSSRRPSNCAASRAPGTKKGGEPCTGAFVALLWQSPPSPPWRSRAVSPTPLPTSAAAG